MSRFTAVGPGHGTHKPNPGGDPAKYVASSGGGGFKRTGGEVNSSLEAKKDTGKYSAAGSSGGFVRTGAQRGPSGSTDKSVTAKGYVPSDGAPASADTNAQED